MPLHLRSEASWLLRRIRPRLAWHIASFICIAGSSLLALSTPLVLKWLIDHVLPAHQTKYLLLAVVLIFLTSQGRTLLVGIGNYLTLRASQKLAIDLRMRVLRHLDMLSADYHESTPVGTAAYPLNQPIDEIAHFGSDLLPAILRTLLATTLTLAAMFLLSVRMTVALLPLIPVFILTRNHFRRELEGGADRMQRDRIAWSSFLQEHLAAVVSIQLLRQEHRQERKLFLLLERCNRSQEQIFRISIWFAFFTSMAVVMGMSAVIGFGGWSVLQGTLTIGGLVAFFSYVTQLFEPLSSVAELYVRAQKTFGSIRQVQSSLAKQPNIMDEPHALPILPGRSFSISVLGLRFAYSEQEPGLIIPSLQIPEAEQIAIAGANGAGKSTFVKLLARLYDPASGQITLGGKDLRHISLKSLRKHLCYLPQYPALFDGTLADNLRFARPTASAIEMEEALEYVGLDNWIRTLPLGLDHWIAPGGAHLSGGQRQRLSIARALLVKPRILILDEAASCLDAVSEQSLLLKLRSLLPGATVIVVSHRLSTVSCMERVLVLENGRIVEDAEPSELRANKNAYSYLFP